MSGVPVSRNSFPSPLVGEAGGGRPASAGQKNPSPAEQTPPGVHSAPPPNPPHKGEGLKRLRIAPDAIAKARRLRRNMTDAERKLWRALKAALPECHWRKQVPLGPYFADFASHGARLIIEVDGGQHGGLADEARTQWLAREGYRVLRFWNHDVLQNLEGVVASIALALEERAR